MSSTKDNALRMLVRGFYDVQKLRIQAGARFVASIKTKLGAKPGVKDEKALEEEIREILDRLTAAYDRLADAFATGTVKEFLESMQIAPGLISDSAELALIANYKYLLESENNLAKAIEKSVSVHPLWKAFLKHVRGVGPLMAGVIITTLDPHKANFPSSFWKYAGLDVAPDGRGRGRYQEHLVPRKYKGRDGEEHETLGLSFNPWLKSKLLGVLADSFIRSRSPYRTVYDDYKNRLLNHPAHKDKRRIHIERMARRYMIKIFLKDLWIAWRELEGLPTHKPYHAEKLGRREHPLLVAPELAAAGAAGGVAE